ncbi:MAG: hypothetical protein IJ199_00045 [Prevotella sp.]|nr:hypothetical protein [Prevotella sp.]
MSKLLNTFQWLKRKPGRLSVGLIMTAIMAASCSDMDEYFETPSWLRGSVYETLEGDGNYSVFLAGAEKAGFRPHLEGKAIVTVMAPTDEQMRSYLQENYGTTDINELSVDEVKKLIGFHILYYSFDKGKMLNFRPLEGDGATDEEKEINSGMYYKFRTRSQDAVTSEKGPVSGGDSAVVSVYHLERFVPVYSYLMFQTKTIDAANNYNYFYPGMWKDDAGFNVSNAGVDEYAVATSNGYIYRVNSTLKPLETIYTELKKRGEKFGRYLKMYDAYGNYELDADLTSTYGNGTDLYQHFHNNGSTLAPIACEWPVTDYRQMDLLSSVAYSVFAFSDDAINEFFNDYWKEGGYESLDDPDLKSSLLELLRNSFVTNSIAFPEEFQKGLVLNYNEDAKNPSPIYINTDEVAQENRVMCSNGVFYGCDELIPPAKYNSVTGPAYQYKKFTYFQNMIESSSIKSNLSQQNEKFILLYPSNEQMKALENYAINSKGALVTVNGNDSTAVSGGTKNNTVYAHVCSPEDGNTDLIANYGSGKHVLQALNPDKKVYWYLKDGKITNSLKHNDLLMFDGNPTTESSVWTTLHYLEYRGDKDGWTNGHAFMYDDVLFHGDYANSQVENYSGSVMKLMLNRNADTTTEFYGWVKLLNAAGLVDLKNAQMSLLTESSLMFVPVTSALESAVKAGKVPGVEAGAESITDAAFLNVTDKDALAKYCLSYFVPLSTAVMSNYPYVGWGEQTTSYGGWITLDQDDENAEIATRLNVYDNGTRLSVGRKVRDGREQGTVNVSSLYDSDYFPFTYDDGGIYFLEGVLPYYSGE